MIMNAAKAALLLLVVAAGVSAADRDRPAEGIPAVLKGFQGMMSGKLLKKGEETLVFKVGKVMKVWKGNEAEDPGKAVGQTLVLSLKRLSDHHRERIMANYRGLKEGDDIELEAFDLGEKALCVNEWLRKSGS